MRGSGPASMHSWKGFFILLSFYDQVTHLTDEGKSVGVVSLDFSKAFDFSFTQYCLGEVGSPWLDQA